MSNHCVRHERCPACDKLGKDRSGNNLAVYSDGSTYCFSCHYHTLSSSLLSFKSKSQNTETGLGELPRGVRLPADVDEVLPQKAWDFLGQYALTEHDAKLNLLLWSEYHQRLIFPYFNDMGLWAWQGRYLGTEAKKAKWFSQGPLHENIHILGKTSNKSIVLTEDVLSAIKVSKVQSVCASPLFGSHISTKLILRLKQFYGTIFIWLDKDKQLDAVKFAKQVKDLGLQSRVIITDKDPKDYNIEDIKEWLYKS